MVLYSIAGAAVAVIIGGVVFYFDGVDGIAGDTMNMRVLSGLLMTALIAPTVGGFVYYQGNRLIGRITLLPNNKLAIDPLSFPSFRPSLRRIVPVNAVVPIHADGRVTGMGSVFKIMENPEQFGKLRYEKAFYIHVYSNSVQGTARAAFEHLAAANTTFKRK
jgi:hypothetical protein